MKYAVTTAPTVEPVTLADAKVHLRTVTGDTSEDSAIISPLITAAREFCENITGRALASQTVKAYPDAWGLWRLPRPPLTSVTSIKYYDEDNVEATLPAANYQADAVDGLVSVIYAPTAALRALNPIVVEYVTGYTTAPMAVRQAMLLLIGHWYTNREAVVIGTASGEIDLTVHRLLNQYREWWC